MTSANVRKPFNKDRTEEKRQVVKDFGTVFFRPKANRDDRNGMEVLDKVRSHTEDWSKDTKRAQIIEQYKHKSGAFLYERGEELFGDDRCDDCQKGLGVWKACVAAPVYDNMALYERECANCRHAGKGAECTLRTDFKAAGGSCWVSFVTDRIRNGGGLFAVKEKDERERAEREEEEQRAQRERDRRRQREEERQRQRENERRRAQQERRRQLEEELQSLLREEEEEKRRAQVERRRRQREREAESEALRHKVPSVVLTSRRNSSPEGSEF